MSLLVQDIIVLTVKTFLFLLILSSAKSEVNNESCKDEYRDQNNNQIDVLKYCSNILCIEKCCGKDEIIDVTNKCMNITKLFKIRHKVAYLASQINYSTNILSSGDGNNQSKKNFVFVQNHREVFNCTSEHRVNVEYNILEDGSLRIKDTSDSKWSEVGRLKYCIEYKLVKSEENMPALKIIIRQIIEDPKDAKLIQTFETVGVTISSLFLLFVLVVYYVIIDNRKFADHIMMSYTFSLLIAFTTKLILTFISMQPELPPIFCKIISPFVYFAFLSSFFWLTVFAISSYLKFRPLNNQRDSKRVERVKYMRYSMFAWGTPFLLTVIVAILDNLPNLDIVPPPFKQCLISGLSFDLYYKIPIGILIIFNIVLFCITVCNIKNAAFGKKIKIVTYTKLCVMMGVFWFLELLPPVKKLWIYILINLINLLTGVIIFYLYVCRKKCILQKLCKKFNIQNDYIKRLESQGSSKSQTTRTTALSSFIVKRTSLDQRQSVELVQNCPQGKNSEVAGEYNIGTYNNVNSWV